MLLHRLGVYSRGRVVTLKIYNRNGVVLYKVEYENFHCVRIWLYLNMWFILFTLINRYVNGFFVRNLPLPYWLGYIEWFSWENHSNPIESYCICINNSYNQFLIQLKSNQKVELTVNPLHTFARVCRVHLQYCMCLHK